MRRDDIKKQIDDTVFKIVMNITSSEFNLHEKTIMSRARDMDVVFSKKVIIYCLDDMMWGCSRIAKYLKFNHATILHHLKNKDADILTYPHLENKYLSVTEKVKNIDAGKFTANELYTVRIKNLLSEYRKKKSEVDKLNRQISNLLTSVEAEILASNIIN